MQIRKLRTLYTIKTSQGKFPKGVYSVDSLRGIPKPLLAEAERGAKTIEILEYEEQPVVNTDVKKEPVEKEPVQEKTVLIDTQETDIQTKEIPKKKRSPRTKSTESTKSTTKSASRPTRKKTVVKE